MATAQPPIRTDSASEPTVGALVQDMTSQMSTLFRAEFRLAQAGGAQKGQRAGVGLGLFSAAGILGLFGFGVLITTIILALALVISAWLAALIVAVLLFAAAGIAALMGKSNVSKATPVMPEGAIEGLKQDVATVKGDGRP